MWFILVLIGFVIIAKSIFSFFSQIFNSLSLPEPEKKDSSSVEWSNNLTVIQDHNLGWLRIVLITNTMQSELACHLIQKDCQDLKALGFDCEWVNSYGKQRPVALLQIATVRGLCCLFRLNVLGTIPRELKGILQDTTILKLGITPLNDAKLLQKDYNTQVCSTLDLRYLYPTAGGLASMAASVIGVNLDKSLHLQCGDWESPELTDSQKEYAAKDALVAVEIFKKWLITRNNVCNLNKPKTYCQLFNEELKFEIYNNYLDVDFKPNHVFSKYIKKNISENNQNHIKSKSGYIARKSPLYHNCFMHAPDGQLLCSCDRRKAQWYIERGLAEILPGEPYSIKLLFEPAARAGKTNEGRFYQQLKQNCCVVCGEFQSYLKHHVVPKEYRKHFPNIMKDHQSHDIVLMCISCHHLASQYNEVLRQKLAVLCNAPIKISKVSQIRSIQKVKNSAKALLVSGDVIPKERKIILENEVKGFFEIDTLSIDILEIGANLESRSISENYECHGIKVVNYFIQEGGGLTALEVLWREHFLDTMKPQYLPALWSTTHNHSRLAATTHEKIL